MNPIGIAKRTSPWLAAAALAAAISMPAYAVDCAAPRSLEETRGCTAAKQGAEALRHYVWRTRMIHNLYYDDYAPFVSGANVSSLDEPRTTVAAVK